MSVPTAPACSTAATSAATPALTSDVAGAQTPSGQPFRRSRHVVAVVLTALLAALVSLTASAGPASAYTITSRSSVPVMPTIYAVQGAHHNTGSAVTGPMWRPYVYQAGPVVSRVSPSGTQYVRGTYTVDRWTGSAWTYETSKVVSGRIDSGVVSVQLPALSQYVGGGAWYRVRLNLTWTSPIGAVIGSLAVTMNGTGEYRCSTTLTCSAATNAVYLR